MQLSANHCPRFGLSSIAALVIMLAASLWVQPAVAGGENKLSHAAMENIRNNVMANWPPPADMTGMKDVRVQVRFELDRAGNIVGKPKVTMTGGPENTQKAVAASAVRAVSRAAPFKNLPIDQYDDWKEVIINFDASDPAN
ncbi:hypothetical protein A6U86_19705 [Rhizobium sp. AC27/96]|uniref:TonB C-terminal domain-containing protein n=1 Tax=Rhizobium TaxID=379 RepID=UPI000828F484|nr:MULTISPECIES: TonB C-terminal domain-containing protein [Rhizobium]NTF43111.1 hypothetical protein [Rhizobium rhizogenes]OCI93258.1 hypothetical protein A6U86_19705 [Rhizobium sp. AC27/96]